MKPPRLPGTERFRFCDKKFEQSKVEAQTLICEDQNDSGIVASSKLIRKDSFLLHFQARSLSNESLVCSCSSDCHHQTADSISNGRVSSCVPEELISQSNLPGTRYEQHNKRKPHLPISSRLTSRVFNLTNCLSHLSEENYFRDKGKQHLYEPVAFIRDIPRNHFTDAFDCSSSSRSSTPTSLDSTEGEAESLPKLSDSKCRIHSVANIRLHNSNTVKGLHAEWCTSHASLMSDESSISSSHQTDCEYSLRSCSCSPDHWAKQSVLPQNRLSSSSHSSWEDGSVLHDVT